MSRYVPIIPQNRDPIGAGQGTNEERQAQSMSPFVNINVVPPSGDPGKGKSTVEVDIPEAEKGVFDAWLRQLWTEKDTTIESFHKNGATRHASEGKEPDVGVDLQLRLKRTREYLDAFCFLLPAGVVYLLGKARS